MFKKQKLFLLIFILAILIRVIYLLITPPRQLPDELYIFERSWNLVINSQDHPISYPNNEYYYPPLYFFLSSVLIKSLLLFWPHPESITQAYYEFHFPLRVVSLFISTTMLYLFWKILEKYKVEKALRISTFTFIALLPAFASFSIFPNHNLLVLFFSTVVIYLFSKDNFQFTNYKQAALAGCIFSLAILTKFDAFIMVPSVVFLALHPKSRRKLVYLLIFTLVTLVFGGWWYALNLARAGWPYDPNLLAAALSKFDKPFSFSGYEFQVLFGTIRTFLETFGIFNQLFLHPSVYAAFILYLFFSLYGLFKNKVFKNALKSSRLYVFLLLMFLVNLALFLQINFIYAFQPQGRYLFPSILFISLALTLGFSSLFKPKYSIPLIIILVSGVLLNVWGYLCIFNAFYGLSLGTINACENMLLQ